MRNSCALWGEDWHVGASSPAEATWPGVLWLCDQRVDVQWWQQQQARAKEAGKRADSKRRRQQVWQLWELRDEEVGKSCSSRRERFSLLWWLQYAQDPKWPQSINNSQPSVDTSACQPLPSWHCRFRRGGGNTVTLVSVRWQKLGYTSGGTTGHESP